MSEHDTLTDAPASFWLEAIDRQRAQTLAEFYADHPQKKMLPEHARVIAQHDLDRDHDRALIRVSMGSVALLIPTTSEAADFLREEVESEPWQWQTMGGGDALAVEPDYAEAILEAWEAR